MKFKTQITVILLLTMPLTAYGFGLGFGKKKPSNDTTAPVLTPAVSGSKDGPRLVKRVNEELAAKDYAAAIKTLQELSLILPGDIHIPMKIASCEEQLGNLDEAIEWTHKAIQIDPKDIGVHNTLGHYFELNREPEAAALQYERAMDLTNSEDQRSALYGPFLRNLIASNQYPKALKESKDWASKNGKNADCHYNYAWVLGQSKDDKVARKALGEYDKALKLDSDLSQANYNAAILLYRFKEKAQASDRINAYLKSNPSEADQKLAQDLLAKIKQN